MQLTFASYNIHKGVGNDGRRDPERVLAVLRELDADVIALQECDRRFGARESVIDRRALDETPWHALPVAPFRDLLAAFRRDAAGDTHRFATFDDVLAYCRCSANPVGRIVLGLFGHRDAERAARSDDVCTALQLTNFWQDLERDWAIGRVYVPEADRAHAPEEDLAQRRMTPAWERVMAEMTRRTRELFEAGRPVCDLVRGRLRWELRLTWLGGSRILDKLEAARFDVFTHRPTLGASDALPLLWQAIGWRRRPL